MLFQINTTGPNTHLNRQNDITQQVSSGPLTTTHSLCLKVKVKDAILLRGV